MRSQSNGVDHGETPGREEKKPSGRGQNGHHGNGQTEQVDEGRGQSCSMQAQRIQRIRGNYQDETRELPSGQDWPRSHSGVEERKGMAEEGNSVMKEKERQPQGGGDA